MKKVVTAERAAADRDPAGRRRRASRAVRYGLLVALTVAYASPLIYMAVTSFKTQGDAIASIPQWIPEHPTLGAYEYIFSHPQTPVLRWFVNSLVAATLHAALVVATAALAAYALARMEFRGKRVILGLVVATLFVPSISLIVPNYLIVSKLAWLDSLVAIIVPSAANAFGVFFLRQFFLGLPRDLEEAARIDGASALRIFWSVVLPLSKPALVTLALLAFLINWNDFVWPVYVLYSAETQTLPAGLAALQSSAAVRYDILMAGAMVAAVPVLVLYAFAQRFVIEGVSRSGLKG